MCAEEPPPPAVRVSPPAGAASQHVQRALLLVFGVALAVRVAYLLDSADWPAFRWPVVDAYAYHHAARELAAGHGFGDRFFWQPFFYPFFLACLYTFVGPAVVVAKIVQIVLGAATCALTARLGQRIFGPAAGLLAGLIAALYGPMIFYEAELVAAGWAAFFSVLLLSILRAVRADRSPGFFGLLGALGGLAVLTRPTFLPFVLVALLWLVWQLWRVLRAGPRTALVAAGAAVVGFLVVVTPVGLLTRAVTGEVQFMPASGGVNFYLGNHPDPTELASAYDLKWDQVNRLPLGAGRLLPYDQQRWFHEQTRAHIRTDPLGFLGRVGVKAVQFVSAREIPRNVDIYVARHWSLLLSLLVWKLDGFGFPFGVLLPLAVVGLVARRRQVPAPLVLFLVFYPAAVISVFVTARYRIPIIPAVCVLAAAGTLSLANVVRTRDLRRLALVGVGGAGVVLIASLPGPFPLEQINFHAMLYENVARTLELEGDPATARRMYDEALRLNPDSHVAHTQLAQQLREQHRVREALPHYQRAVELRPDVGATHLNYGIALAELGRVEEALAELRRAVTIDPNYALGYAGLGGVLFAERRFEQAAAAYRQAVRLAPGNPAHHTNLGLSLLRAGAVAEAIDVLVEGRHLHPASERIGFLLATTLDDAGRHAEAAEAYQAVLRLAPGHSDARRRLERVEARLRQP
ncbi:MAG: tetratricopeptide repeat protein [Planctomycetota bacterium]